MTASLRDRGKGLPTRTAAADTIWAEEAGVKSRNTQASAAAGGEARGDTLPPAPPTPRGLEDRNSVPADPLRPLTAEEFFDPVGDGSINAGGAKKPKKHGKIEKQISF